MKFNFRKIASVFASVVMLGSTVGIAAAANYPAPFVSGGSADVAIIYGNNAAFSDGLAAGEIQSSLQFELGKQTASGGSTGNTATASGGDSVQITKSSDKVNLGNGIGDIWGTAITGTDLKTVLASGSFYNKQNTEYKYTQKIDLGNLTFTDFSDSDYQNRLPTLGFQLSSNTYVMNYTLDFETDPEATHGTDLTDFENKNIQMLGKDYYILDFKNSTAKMTLLDSASTATLNEGESKTVTVGSKEYAVSIGFITTDQVVLTVDGVNTDKLSATGTTYGNTYKLPDGTYVGIKTINVQDYAGGLKSVEFSIGSGKLELTDGSNPKINDKTVTDLTSYIFMGTSGSKATWQKLGITWRVDNEAFLTPGKELTMPGFEAVKLVMADTTMPAVEETQVNTANEVLELKTTIKDGVVSIPILYASTTTGNITGIGKSATQKLQTSNSTLLTFNATAGATQYEGFIASWASSKESETYYLKASVSRDLDAGKNYTAILNKLTNTYPCGEKLEAGQACTIGNVVLTVAGIPIYTSTERSANFTINSGGSFYKLYTKGGLTAYLPFALQGNSTTKGGINLTDGTSYAPNGNNVNIYTLWFGEQDKDGTLDQVPFNMTIDDAGSSTKYITVSAVGGAGTAYETPTSSSKIWESYVFSDLASKILHDKTGTNQYSASVEYHGGQVYANVFVAAPSATVSGGGTSTTGGSVANLGYPVYKDTEVSSVSTKNLIVVGGSCINTVAAKILGSDTAKCGADFTTLATVGANQALVKVVTSPYSATKVAMLIAGYEAADTTKAAKYVTTEMPATDVDTTTKLSTSSAVATVVTA